MMLPECLFDGVPGALGSLLCGAGEGGARVGGGGGVGAFGGCGEFGVERGPLVAVGHGLVVGGGGC